MVFFLSLFDPDTEDGQDKNSENHHISLLHDGDHGLAEAVIQVKIGGNRNSSRQKVSKGKLRKAGFGQP